MEFYVDLDQILKAYPVYAAGVVLVVVAIVTEAGLLVRRDGQYPWRDAWLSICMTIGHYGTQAIAQGVMYGIIAATVYKFRLFTIAVSWAHWPTVLLLFLVVDFVYYVEHLCSHRSRILWASHSVHHSGERMIATTALRLPWTPLLSGVFLFYLPVVWIGFNPVWVYTMVSANAAYQFFVHTELVPHVRWLEWVLDTPSSHRVHHASNPEYIDRNFGGTLMIWDHLFGTYQAELPNVPMKYGLVHRRSHPNNPFVIAYEGMWEILKGLFQSGGVREKWARVFGPP